MAVNRSTKNAPSALPDAGHEQADGTSRVDDAYQQILARIIRGQLPGGTPLKSTQIAADLGLSRTPVVQALARLAADGIVTQRRHQRAVVCPNAGDWLLEIHELRLLLEPAAAARAAEAMPAEVIARLRDEEAEVAPLADDQWVVRAREFDFSLHLTIAEWSRNRPLRDAIHKCWQYKRLSYELEPDRSDAIERGLREHSSILAAIEARDGPTAAAAMEIHLRHASSYRPQQKIV